MTADAAQLELNQRLGACIVALAHEAYDGGGAPRWYATRICRNCQCGTSGGGCWYCTLTGRAAA